MIRFAWGIRNTTTVVTWTSSVLSFTYNNGRQSYLDNYNAGALTLTIKNQANESAGFSFGDQIDLLDPVGFVLLSFFVVEISYNDYPGNTGLSTATIVCQDSFGLMGRLQMNSFAVPETFCNGQFSTTSSVPGKVANQPTYAFVGSGGSAASAGTYSGSVLNLWNLLINTERGLLSLFQKTATFYTRDGISQIATNAFTFGRTPSASVIGYDSFERINLGLDYMNQVQTQPAGLAIQQATNAASVSSYGGQGFTVSTVDNTTDQALGLAQWLANTLSDPLKQRFVVTFTDRMQSVTTQDFYNFLKDISLKTNNSLTYRVPGSGSDTTVSVIVEGYQVSATPEQTTVTAYLTPLTYYQFFTLNSSTLGILDTSRLGW